VPVSGGADGLGVTVVVAAPGAGAGVDRVITLGRPVGDRDVVPVETLGGAVLCAVEPEGSPVQLAIPASTTGRIRSRKTPWAARLRLMIRKATTPISRSGIAARCTLVACR
jgi:hypothetical protein